MLQRSLTSVRRHLARGRPLTPPGPPLPAPLSPSQERGEGRRCPPDAGAESHAFQLGDGFRSASFGTVVCILLFTGVDAAADEPPPAALDLERVVELALAQNPALQAEAERRTEVAGGVDEVAADAWPQLDLVGSWSRSRNPAFLNSPDFEDIVAQFPDFTPGEQELWDVGVELRQTLYSGGKVRAAVDLAKLVVGVTEAQIGTVELDTALEAAEAYFSLLRAKGALETVEIQRQARRRSLEVVEVRYELGSATRLELLRARSALAAVEPSVAQIRGQIDVARSRLSVILGLDLGTEIEVLPADAELPETPELDQLLSIFRDRRPELEDLELQGQALQRQEVIANADGRPQVELAGLYGRQVRLVDDLSDSLFANWQLSLGLTWSLFDGGRRKGELAQLESRRRQLEWRLRDLENEIAREIEEVLVEYRTALERRRAAEIAARAAREATRVAVESYGEGVALQADLLDAQEEETQAELVSIEALYDAWIQAARLLRAVGKLPTDRWEER